VTAEPPLLTLRQGTEGPFLRWLEELGLKDFIRTYPVSRLVEWGWLEPQFRYVFPEEFFDNFPRHGRGPIPNFDTEDLLWDSTWSIRNEEHELWFLHPHFHPGDIAGSALKNRNTPGTKIEVPPPFEHPEEGEVRPYADYFFHWQGYALVDVIRFSDCITPLLNTPDALERADSIKRIAEELRESDPKEVLRLERRWGGFSGPMTWLSHYRSFVHAAGWPHCSRSEMFPRRRRGAKALAVHLGVTADRLSAAIKGYLLVLADDWSHANKTARNNWTRKPFEHLRLDVLSAVEWLSYLSDQTTEHYLKEWRHKHWGHNGWAELREVLPFEWFEDRENFLSLSPHYLKAFNVVIGPDSQLTDSALSERVDELRASNAPFGSFLSAFRSMHDQLSTKRDKEAVLDFRDLRPLDGYLLLAIRVEAILRFALEESGELGSLPPSQRKLSRFIALLATRLGLSKAALKVFENAVQKVAGLHQAPTDGPIKPVMTLETGLSSREDYLIKSFLCSVVARNYFAHHYYFDANLWRSNESAYLLSGIITTVLWLTPGKGEARSREQLQNLN
jgi:hypothetical protein